MLFPWVAMARGPMHVNAEPVLQNLNPERNFVHAIRSMWRTMLLASKAMSVVEDLHVVLPSHVVSIQ